jgi:ribosomal protein S18 acetylase RimI-like enzyme
MATISSCKTDEIPAVLALWANARSAAASTPDTPAALERLCARNDGALLIAKVDGHVVGTLIAASDGWRGNMYRLTVAPTHRRRGIARRLVAAGEAQLRDRGVTRITALVDARDDVATRVWESVGYRHDAAIARFVRNV